MIHIDIFSDSLYINISSLNSDTIAYLISVSTSRGCASEIRDNIKMKVTGPTQCLYSFIFEVTCCHPILME